MLNAKSKLVSYKIPGTYRMTWSFHHVAAFTRYDKYLQRLHSIRNIFETANEFIKLDRIEFGGLKGRYLSNRMADVSHDYQRLYNLWTTIDFDILDPDEENDKKFNEMKRRYQEKADGLERTLAQIFVEAFHDCYTTEHCIKVSRTFPSIRYVVVF